jgi:hypothetical protein
MTIDLEKLIDQLEMAKANAEHNARVNQGDSATFDRGRYAGLKEALEIIDRLARP